MIIPKFFYVMYIIKRYYKEIQYILIWRSQPAKAAGAFANPKLKFLNLQCFEGKLKKIRLARFPVRLAFDNSPSLDPFLYAFSSRACYIYILTQRTHRGKFFRSSPIHISRIYNLL